MRFSILVMLTFVACLRANGEADKKNAFLKQLQGKWELTEGIKDGEKFEPKNAFIEIKENEMIVEPDTNRKHSFLLTIESLDNPVGIDMRIGKRVGPAIVELNKDILQIAVALEGSKTRPKKFEGGKDILFIKLKRAN